MPRNAHGSRQRIASILCETLARHLHREPVDGGELRFVRKVPGSMDPLGPAELRNLFRPTLKPDGRPYGVPFVTPVQS
jgi:hypothetical protein